jgi:hypothetical protein
MGFFGSLIAGGLGSLLGKKVSGGSEAGGAVGAAAGKFLGGLLPFKHGGYVKKTTPALLHAGEFVLPAGVPPTKAQRAKVMKGKKDKKGKK